ncbi:P-loop NTPase fold protein [Pedobacter sp. GR22-6]|uniref:P-loop NTPase fold protein n=1 Tax=Pedobacter sp. GR22-6 TaxID=3127957 RepID=UPI00307ED9F4
MSLIIDKEIDLSKEDLLDTKVYAATLKKLILTSPKNEPLTIGLFGPWGSGKSSIIRTLKNEIGVDLSNISEDKNPKKKNSQISIDNKVGFVIYDAWKYANDSFRRTFLLTLMESLQLKETTEMNNFYASNSEEVDIKFKFNIPFIILVLAVFIAIIYNFFGQPSQTLEKWTWAAIASFLSYTTAVLSKTFIELKKSVQHPIISAPELFERCFNNLIKSALSSKIVKSGCCLTTVNAPKFDKIVIVLDNIDRCSKESAYELLTNTKNFIESNYSVIFLLPVDDEALKRHLFKSEGEISGDQAEEFLRKYFNVVVRMKNFRNTEIFDFANQINEKYTLNLKKDTVNIIAREYAKNPRRIIQFFNNLSIELKMMNLKHGADFCIPNEAAICKLLIIREQWPNEYRKICDDPKAFLDNSVNIYHKMRKTQDRQTIAAESFESFLNMTYVSTRNLAVIDLQKILMNSNNYETLPDELADVIAEGDSTKIEIMLSKSGFSKDRALNHLLFRLQGALGDELYNTDVSETMNQIMGFLLAEPESDFSYFIRLEATIDGQISTLIPSTKYFERLIIFNKLFVSKGLISIKSGIKAHLKYFSPKADDKFKESDFELYHQYLSAADDDDTREASGFFPIFLKNRPWDKRILEDLRTDQFDILYNAFTIDQVFFDGETPVWLDQNFDHWMELLDKLKDQVSFVKQLLGRAGSSLEVYHEGTDRFVSKFRGILMTIKVSGIDPWGLEQLENINRHIFILEPGKSDLFMTAPTESRPEIFKYLLETFRLTKGSPSSIEYIMRFFKLELLPPYADSLAHFVYKNKFDLDFSPLKELVISVPFVDDGIHHLQMQMLYLEVDREPIFSDKEIVAVLNELVGNITNYEDYAKYLKDHATTERGKALFSDIVRNTSKKSMPAAIENILKGVSSQENE